MIKKLMILMIISVLSLVLYNQSVSAETVLIPEPAVDTGGLWHVEDGNKAYVNMRYTHGDTVYETGTSTNETHPEYDLSLYTLWYGVGEDLNFPKTSLYDDYDSISNPNPAFYDKFVVEIIPSMIAPAADYPGIKIYDSTASEIEIFLHDYDDDRLFSSDWSYITLFVDNNEILSSRNLRQELIDIYALDVEPNPYADGGRFGVRMYWEHTVVEAEIDPGTTVNPWEALPDTTGSPVNPSGEWGTVSDIIVDNQNISFNINYRGTQYPFSSFTVTGNLDFINKSNDVLFYSDPSTGDRILYFNFGETLDSAILAARSFSNVNEWKGEALWNLTQNEIKVTGVLPVYNYIPEVDDAGNVYSYFYMPDVPIDDLISVSSVLAYRYYDQEFLGMFGDLVPGDIQYKTVAAVRGETTAVNPTWVETTYRTAYLTAALLGVATVAGVVPVYGWGVAGAAFLVAGGIALQAADVNEWFAYDVEQIQHVIPSVALTNEINTYISQTSGDAQFTADTNKLYKLHLAVLDDYADVEVMSELSNVTQVVWETDGEIFVVNEEYIANIDWGGPGTLVPVNPPGDDDLEMTLIIAGIGLVGLYIISSLKLHKKPILMFLIVGTALYILYEMGLL
jgi:hypothetical protein